MTTSTDALGAVELASVARGFTVLDAVAKRARVSVVVAEPVSPGKFLLVFVSDIDSVNEALDAALSAAASTTIDSLCLPAVHPALALALRTGSCDAPGHEAALGVVEVMHVIAALRAADAALKSVDVTLTSLRLANALGGKAWFSIAGALADVEAAIDVAATEADGALIETAIIAQPQAEARGFFFAQKR
jgi:microcompartment protein CcmL/EutN